MLVYINYTQFFMPGCIFLARLLRGGWFGMVLAGGQTKKPGLGSRGSKAGGWRGEIPYSLCLISGLYTHCVLSVVYTLIVSY